MCTWHPQALFLLRFIVYLCLVAALATKVSAMATVFVFILPYRKSNNDHIAPFPPIMRALVCPSHCARREPYGPMCPPRGVSLTRTTVPSHCARCETYWDHCAPSHCGCETYLDHCAPSHCARYEPYGPRAPLALCAVWDVFAIVYDSVWMRLSQVGICSQHMGMRILSATRSPRTVLSICVDRVCASEEKSLLI